MKIKDIIAEGIIDDMADIDVDYNPHHLEYIQKQERRQDLINKEFKDTAIFKKPARKSEKPFSNTPPKHEPQSAGYRGLTDTNVRAGHITKEQGEEFTNIVD